MSSCVSLCLEMVPFLCLVLIFHHAESIQVTTEGSRTIGEQLNMSCSISNVQRPLLSDKIELIMTLEKIDSDQGSGGIVFNGNNQTPVQLYFDHLQYTDRGSYLCTASIVNTSSFTVLHEYFVEYNLTLKLSAAPVMSTIEVAVPEHAPIFIGERILLTCNYTLQISHDYSYVSTLSWRRDGVMVTEDSSVILVHENQTKHASELSDIIDSSSVQYTCEVSLVPVTNDPFLTGVNYTNDLVLYGKDPPLLTISHRGNEGVLGSPYTINCSTSLTDTTIVKLSWFKVGYSNTSYELNATVKSTTFVEVSFNELSLEDAGTYICKAIVNNKRVVAVNETDLLLTTPFNVTLKQSGPFYLIVKWSAPLSFSGRPSIVYTVTTNVTGSLITPINTNPLHHMNTVSYNISGLRPFQYVAVSITAQSGSDEGDPVSIVFVTSEYVPAPVTGLSVSRINASSVMVTWESVPSAKVNGILVGYLVYVYSSSLSLQQLTEAGPDDTSIIITKLVPKTRYLIEVISHNFNYQSDPAQVTFYTVEGVLDPPANINVQILNSTHIMITWTAVNDTRGSVYSYMIMTADGRTYKLLPTKHSFVIHGVINSAGIYGFRMATINGDRVRGSWSPWITNAESSYIQLRGGTFKSCTEWSDSDRVSIMSLFRQSLMNYTSSYCTHCEVGPVYTLLDDTVSCDLTTPTDAVYRTSLTGIFPYTTSQLVNLISDWIMGGVTITSGITQITLNSYCPVAIETADEPLCKPNLPSDGDTKSEGGAEVILVTVLMVVVVLSCTVSIIVCVYIITWRSQRIQTWRFIPCPTPEGHPWTIQDQKEHLQNVPTMFANTSIEGFDGGNNEEEAESTTSGDRVESPCKEDYDETTEDEGDKDLESGVYDPSNLTIIYESDDESSKL